MPFAPLAVFLTRSVALPASERPHARWIDHELAAARRHVAGMDDSASHWERAEAAATITVDSALAVHSYAGPGLLERTYVVFLAEELKARGIPVRTQVLLRASYRNATVDLGYRVDLLVDDALIVEVKACAQLLPVHSAQLLSYLRLADRRIGLLINFHEGRLKNGIRRIINSRKWPSQG